MNRLYLCRGKQRQTRGSSKSGNRTPSRFLANVPPEWMETREVSGAQPASLKTMREGIAGLLAALGKA